MQACLFCCPASVTEHEEGEPETIIHQLWEHVESVVEKIDDGIDAVQDKVEDVVEAVVDAVDDVRDAIVDALGLNDKFVEVSDNALDDIAPKAGDVVIEEASNFIPAFQKLDDRVPQDLDGAAKAACAATILGFRGKIHDFCQDVVELLKEGVEKAVELLKAVIPDCCEAACLSCMGLASKLGQWISTAFNRIVDMVEDFLKAAMRTFGVPEWICEKVDFNGNASADNANDDDEPLNHHHHALKDEDAPAQQAMGGGGASSP
jgi:phage-related protein